MSDGEAQHGGVEAGPEPRAVAAGRGWYWIATGFNDHYAKAPGPWIAATVLIAAITLLLGMIPIINLAGSILGTVFSGGLMLGCHAQRRGEPFRIGHVFAAFSSHGRNLAIIGLVYTVANALVALLLVSFAGLSLGAAGEPTGAPLSVLMAALVALVLLIPVIMAYWFAPVLVVLGGCQPVDAMKRSFIACQRNMVPFLVYGAAMAGITIVALIPLGLGLLIAIPTIVASIYVAWQDIFEEPDAVAVGPNSRP